MGWVGGRQGPTKRGLIVGDSEDMETSKSRQVAHKDGSNHKEVGQGATWILE